MNVDMHAVREFVNKHGKYIAAGCGVVAILAILLFNRSGLPNVKENPSYGFYVDEGTGEEVVRPVTEVPPLAGKDGKATVVRAVKFSCEGKQAEVGYFMKYPPAVQSSLQSMAFDDVRRPDLLETEQLVRLPRTGSPWVKGSTEEGEKIKQGPPCSGKLRMVHPVP